MRRTNIYLDPDQTDRLDRLAADAGISRAELIRRLLERALGGGQGDLTSDLDAIDSAFGAMSELSVPTRAPDARARHLERLRSTSG
jgi:hypothetical protein